AELRSPADSPPGSLLPRVEKRSGAASKAGLEGGAAHVTQRRVLGSDGQRRGCGVRVDLELGDALRAEVAWLAVALELGALEVGAGRGLEDDDADGWAERRRIADRRVAEALFEDLHTSGELAGGDVDGLIHGDDLHVAAVLASPRVSRLERRLQHVRVADA